MSGHGYNAVGSNGNVEVKQCSQDVRMTKEDAKVHLGLALNKNTLSCEDMYVAMYHGDEMTCLETVQDRLHCVSYF